ncbi:MAG TPA: nucleotidyltransferase domain-containing protein, partial [Chondromyces sp.]|nr:nucleotidyltransferase domain-containing protein [Chondromyces sp.]
MKETIIRKIKEIEEIHHIKVLYAVEAGSRAWRVASENSDYDARFIYVHHRDWYLSIDPQSSRKKRDVIELPINDSLDINGWELTKALRLFRKSNPTLLEWLQAVIVYKQADFFIDKMRKLEAEVFNSKVVLYHYLNMARKNYRIIQSGNLNVKLYIHTIRPLMACKWIECHDSFPPNNIHHLVDSVVLDRELKHSINQILMWKMEGNERKDQMMLKDINQFIDEEIQCVEGYVKTVTGEKADPTP